MKNQKIKKIYKFLFYNNTPIIILGLVFSVGILAFAANDIGNGYSPLTVKEDNNIIVNNDPKDEGEQDAGSNEVKNSKLGKLKIKEKYDKSDKIKGKYRLEKTAFILDAVDENAIQAEVGNKNSDEFEPEFTIRKWNDEVNLKIKYKHNTEKNKQNVDLEGNKIKWKGEKTEVHYYEMKKGEILLGNELESDVYEIEVILLEKPDLNIVEFDIETKGLNFYYQPPLDEEKQMPEVVRSTPTDCYDKDDNVICHRPENVVGSYSVYHESKAGDYSKMGLKNYRAGIAFHIYRPKIIDSAGTEVWGKLNITNNLLTVEIPQVFLDNAVYPIRHAAGLTFGYTTIGTGAGFSGLGQKGSWFTSGGSGTIDSISVVVSSAVNVQAAIFKKSDGSLIDYTEKKTATAGDWTTLDMILGGSVVDDDYWLILWAETGTTYYKTGTEANKRSYISSRAWNLDWQDPWDGSLTSGTVSIYCTYTAAASTYQPRPGGVGVSGGGFMMY